MEMIGYLLSGGFAKNYRTYIMAGVVIVTAVAGFAVGDINLNTMITQVAGGLGLGALRSALGDVK